MPNSVEALAFIHSQNDRIRRPIPAFLKQQAQANPIYIFNIYPREHRKTLAGIGIFTVPACPPGEPHSPPLIVPSTVFEEYDTGDGKGTMAWNAWPGSDVAKDIIGIGSYTASNTELTTDMTWYGVFIAAGSTPTEEELAAAREKLTEHMRWLLAAADRLAMRGGRSLEEIGQPHREAAIFLKQPRSWANPVVAMQQCEACGAAIQLNVAACQYCGAVLDMERAAQYWPDKYGPHAHTPKNAKV